MMASPIDAIPSLIPVPPPSKSKPPSSAPSQSESQNDAEAAIDKFATLFSPATPRASPTLAPTSTNPKSNARPIPRPRQLPEPPSSDDSEFGSFVSVPATEDPLSMFSLPSPGFSLPPPLRSSPSTSQSPNPSSKDQPSIRQAYAHNSSLNFFDKFAQDAKQASERNRRGVLDELLLHEDDPLYWLKDPEPGLGKVGELTETAVAGGKSKPKNDYTNEAERSGHQNAEASLLDLDFDYFTTKPDSNPVEHERQKSSSPSRRTARASYTQSPHSPPTRSTSLQPPTLAPPLASTSPVSSSPPIPIAASDPDISQSHTPRPLTPRSASYQTLTNLSSRWMSSLLPSSRPSPPNAGAGPTLESLFAPPTSSDPALRPHSRVGGVLPTPLPSRGHSPTPPPTHPHPHHSSTFSFSSNSSFPAAQISHGTPFAPSTLHNVSPFAAHVYIPPTGAPGFRGEGYDWDKGFSKELERELEVAGMGDGGDRELVGVKSGKGKVNLVGTISGVGGLMEKRSGSIELRGRREATVEVLEVELADQIRSHLPALSRLPRSWNLLYSLDQHGISLNTLYTRCENQRQVKPGAVGSAGSLVVIKDAGDGVFGAWIGEGIRISKGKGYYGGGESFLWRFVGGKFEVFKWTGRNEYVALCEPEYISFGGGDGQYGLYLDDTLFDGSSARCPTFDNPPLCSLGPKKGGAIAFECVGLEVWGVGP